MKTITLEMSLKPFKQTDDKFIETVCSNVFMQWYPFLKTAEEICVMLWTADGSEILDYSGSLDDEFEWCCYIGTANLPLADKDDRPDRSLHERKRFYIDNPPKMTYGILKKIVSAIKAEGKKLFPNKAIRVGETFDIGPEFAVSDFKYKRHTEICSGTTLDHCGFVDATSRLNGDTRKYAAYPDGIPDQTPFGLFLGKQTQAFFADMGFDYLWLSNGLGFSSEPWDLMGKIYDGKSFYPEKLDRVKREVFEFWKYFREGCPNYQVQTRGTNNSVGIDYATDGVPLYDIYNGDFDITAPPNSPWAAINDDVGLELMGHMSRICELPGKDFMFRYYLHDPWWVNTPWYDRYGSSPHDIYLPMAISRIDRDGKVQNAQMFNILSIDNSFGDMPDNCVNETIPHFLRAEKDFSDEPSPFVWVYPMREYTKIKDEENLYEMYFGDNFIKDSINAGFLLNCVVSSDSFLRHDKEIYKRSIIVSPVPSESVLENRLNALAKCGINTIVYGRQASLEKVCLCDEIIRCDIEEENSLMSAARKLGYEIFRTNKPCEKSSAVFAVNKSNNAFWLSLYNRNTAEEYSLKFPPGAPVFIGTETTIKNGYSTYHFSRGGHLECRLFVKQCCGTVSVKEYVSVNNAVRRRILVRGLKNATVYFFPEGYCVDKCKVSRQTSDSGDGTPTYLDDWAVQDDGFGRYMIAENITGNLVFHMPRKSFLEKGGTL